MIKKSLLASAVCVILGAMPAMAGYYACGSFNGWSTYEAQAFAQGADGVWSATIDFSSGTAFKVSSALPEPGSPNQGWDIFDAGSINPVSEPQLNHPVAYTIGVNNINVPERKTYTLLINDETCEMAVTDGSAEIAWGEVAKPWSGTLPVLFINTENAAPVVTKESYLKGTYYLDPMGVEGVQAFGSVEDPLPLQIKGRGNWTWTAFDKKPYRLKLDSKAGLLGMKKSKHFALLAHADDYHGFMRNHLGFEVSRRIGLDWTPADQPVELVLNGEYKGLYFLTETIRIDKDRVNIFEQPDGDASDNVTGGWLVELDNYDTDPHVEFYSEVDWGRMIFTYKTPEEVNADQANWLKNQMKAIDHAIASQDKSHAAWLDYIDVEALAKFYIVQEVMDNYESFTGSCYMHRDIDDPERAVDGQAEHKWKFGPVWDFGSTLNEDKQQWCYQGRPHRMAWIGEMCKFPEFMDAVKEEWKAFYPAKYGDMDAYIQAHVDAIYEAARSDYARWPQYGNKDMDFQAWDVKRRMDLSVNWLADRWGRGEESGIEAVDGGSAETIDVTVVDGAVEVYAREAQTVTVARADGAWFAVSLSHGVNRLDLPAGFYIIGGKKVMTR